MNCKSFIAASVLTLAFFAAPTVLAQVQPYQDFTCTSPIGDDLTDIRNVTVPAGESCELNGTVVAGNVTVLPGGQLDVEYATIYGNVEGDGAERITLYESAVGGDIVVNRGTGYFLIGYTDVAGSVLFDATNANCKLYAPRYSCLEVLDNLIGGELVVQNSSARGKAYGFRLEENTLQGDLWFQGNRGVGLVGDNFRIGGNLYFMNNVRKGIILRNEIDGNLICEGNQPPPAVRDNNVLGDIACASPDCREGGGKPGKVNKGGKDGDREKDGDRDREEDDEDGDKDNDGDRDREEDRDDENDDHDGDCRDHDHDGDDDRDGDSKRRRGRGR